MRGWSPAAPTDSTSDPGQHDPGVGRPPKACCYAARCNSAPRSASAALATRRCRTPQPPSPALTLPATASGRQRLTVTATRPGGIAQAAGRLGGRDQHRAQQQLPGLEVRAQHQRAEPGSDGAQRVGRHRGRGQLLAGEQAVRGARRRPRCRPESASRHQHADRLLPRDGAVVCLPDVGQHRWRCRPRRAATPARRSVRDASRFHFLSRVRGPVPAQPVSLISAAAQVRAADRAGRRDQRPDEVSR